MARKEIPIDLAEVEKAARTCSSLKKIADALGISEDTLARRRQSSADFAEAIKRGQAKAEIRAGDKLMELIEKGNLGAIIFFLKCRCGWCETQKIEADVTTREGIPEGLPAIYAALKKHTSKND